MNFFKNFILYPFILIFFFNIFLNFNSNIKVDNDNLKINIFENKIKRDFPTLKKDSNKEALEYFTW